MFDILRSFSSTSRRCVDLSGAEGRPPLAQSHLGHHCGEAKEVCYLCSELSSLMSCPPSCPPSQKYYGLNTKVDDRSDSKWGDIEQWMVQLLCAEDITNTTHAFSMSAWLTEASVVCSLRLSFRSFLLSLFTKYGIIKSQSSAINDNPLIERSGVPVWLSRSDHLPSAVTLHGVY